MSPRARIRVLIGAIAIVGAAIVGGSVALAGALEVGVHLPGAMATTSKWMASAKPEERMAGRCEPEPVLSRPAVHPLDGLSVAELGKRVRAADHEISAPIGSPTRGALWNGVRLESSASIESVGNPWGTGATTRSIERAVREVQRCFADTPKLFVGDISAKNGGPLRPHRSHQSGLDADVGYYYLTGPAWFVQVTSDNLDRPRTWALVRALIDGGNVEYVFIDQAVQEQLRAHAAALGDPVDALFASEDSPQNVIRHVRGHNAHFHVRFHDPEGAETAQRVLPHLPRYRSLVQPLPGRRSRRR